MNKNSNAKRNSFSLATVLFLILFILKLSNNTDLSWWWVTSPLWLPLVVVGGIFLVCFVLALIFN